MRNHDIKKIVYDLDNTPWDWVAAAVHIYPAMHHTLVRETGLSRQRIKECMQHFYGRAGTLEASWLVQDLERQGVLEGLDLDLNHLILKVRKAFHMNRQKHLRLFEGFPEVFQQGLDRGIKNLILTDAPACHAASRLIHFNLNQGYFEHMYAMRDSLPEEVPHEFHQKYDRGRYGLSFPVTLLDHEKPHTDMTALLGMTEDEISQHVAFVGDNYHKDMALAARYGSLGIHAAWGRASQEYLNIVADYSGASIANRNAPLVDRSQNYPNVVTAKHPREIADILGWQ